ncbi:Phosphoribosylformylglycinamidine synthase [Bienertia sinuspersici]
MVALASLPNPFATFISYKAYKSPRKTLIQCLINVPSSSLRRAKRKNYLRPKILKTLTKPYNIPLGDPTVDPIKPIEPNVEVPLEPVTKNMDSSFVEESKSTLGSDDTGLSELEVAREPETRKLVHFGGLSGRTVVRIVGSFVGLFILQSVVAAWVTGSGNSDEKNGNLVIEDQKRNLRLRRGEVQVGFNRNGFQVDQAGVNVDELEMEAKISEIRKMAWEVREAEKKKKSDNGEADLDDDAVDEEEEEEDDSEDTESANLWGNTGIVKEVDGRLSKLRKRYSAPRGNVNFMNKSGDPGKDGSLAAEEDNMLLYKMKHKFRSHLTTPKDKPRGFQSIDDTKEKHSNVDEEKPVEQIGNTNDVNLDNVSLEKHDDGIDKVEKIPVSQSSTPLKGFRKRSGSSTKKKLDNGSTTSGSNGTAKNLTFGMNGDAKSERGLVQESSNGNILDKGHEVKKSSTVPTSDKVKMNNQVASTSETLAEPRRKGQPHSNKQGSRLLQGTYKDEKDNTNPWWLKLPYVFVSYFDAKGIGNEAERGFYNLMKESDADNLSNSSYTVAFEDRTDAQNFSYLLESAFEDVPDAAIDIAPLSRKDFKEVAESLENKVFCRKEGRVEALCWSATC